jgi:hypothetical protein
MPEKRDDCLMPWDLNPVDNAISRAIRYIFFIITSHFSLLSQATTWINNVKLKYLNRGKKAHPGGTKPIMYPKGISEH